MPEEINTPENEEIEAWSWRVDDEAWGIFPPPPRRNLWQISVQEKRRESRYEVADTVRNDQEAKESSLSDMEDEAEKTSQIGKEGMNVISDQSPKIEKVKMARKMGSFN